MPDSISILWTSAGETMPSLGGRSLVDISDGDTPNIRMPIRMLSVDTPEVTARSESGARRVDERFQELAAWITAGKAPVSDTFAGYIVPKLETGNGGTLQFEQGNAASAWFKARVQERLKRESGRRRNLFIRTAEQPFDRYHRILAYVAPDYSRNERETMSRRERSTFNLDLVESGWASPFIIFPNIPGQLDLPIFVAAARSAVEQKRGQHADPLSLPAYEYRMCEKLYTVTKKLVSGGSVSAWDRYGWRTRYAADMTTRVLYGPESYMGVPAAHRIWVWPDDVQEAMAMLNLTPAPELVE